MLGRVGRSVGYAVGLVVLGGVAVVGSVVGRGDSVYWVWRRVARFQGTAEVVRLRRPRWVASVVHGVVSLGLGLLSLFLVGLWGIAVVRGPFYGFVDDGPYGPGTWGGPSKAGAWGVHAAVAVPVIVLLPFVLRGVGLLQAALSGGFTDRGCRDWCFRQLSCWQSVVGSSSIRGHSSSESD